MKPFSLGARTAGEKKVADQYRRGRNGGWSSDFAQEIPVIGMYMGSATLLFAFDYFSFAGSGQGNSQHQRQVCCDAA